MSICSFARAGLAVLHEATVRPRPGGRRLTVRSRPAARSVGGSCRSQGRCAATMWAAWEVRSGSNGPLLCAATGSVTTHT